MRYLTGLLILIWTSGAISQADSLTLSACLDMALRHNPVFSSVQYEEQMSRQDYRQAVAERLPTLDVDASLRYQSDIPELDFPSLSSGGGQVPIALFPGGVKELGSKDSYDFSITISQPLFTGFRLKNRQAIADAMVKNKSFLVERQRSSLIYSVVSNYGNVLRAQHIADIAKTSRNQIEEHLQDLRNFFSQGVATKDDLLKVEVRLSEAELSLLKAENAVDIARTALEQVVGKALPADATFAIFEIDYRPADLQGCLDTAMTNRPEIHAMQKAEQTAEIAIKIQQGAYYPSLAAFAKAGYGKPGLDFIRNEWMHYWVVGVGVEWPIWQWQKKDAKIEKTKLAHKKVLEEERELRNNIRMDVTHAWLTVKEKKASLRLTTVLLQQAQQSFQTSHDHYRQGMASNTAFLDAQSDLTRAELQKVKAFIDLQLARADLKRAMGMNDK